MPSVILLIIDGLGDLPAPKTPLQAAKTPNMDFLAKKGSCGLLSTIAPGIVPGSDVSHLSLLGYDPEKHYPGRGPLEAMGMGLKMQESDVAFRVNLATIRDGKIVDRRAGRITTSEARKLERDVNMRIGDVEVIFKSSVEHRGALLLRGNGLSANVTDTDPHTEGPWQACVPSDDSATAKKTAEVINTFSRMVQGKLEMNAVNKKRKLPANIVLLRSGGVYRRVPSITDRFGIRTACVAGGALYRGVARYIGMEVLDVQGATGTAQTNLKAKAAAAVRAGKKYDLVFVHVKAVDSFGHDGDFKGKTRMLERVDRELVAALRKSDAYIIITGDHSTPCVRKAHSGHEVPILMVGPNERQDNVKKFDEVSCMAGGLGHLQGKDVMPMLLNLLGRGRMRGS